MKSTFYKSLGMGMLLIGVAGLCLGISPVPEIDGAGAVNALALLSGVVLVIRGRKR